MTCYNPMTAVVLGLKSNGKKDIRILNSDLLAFYERDPMSFIFNGYQFNGKLYSISDVIQLPCGRCVGCRLDRSRQWADRCMLELQYHKSFYFVTLTYDDDHVPLSSYCSDFETGECSTSLSLCKRDFQLFMKRLRKRFSNQKIRFFAAGEYGSITFRPHYHAILFGLDLDDLVPSFNSALGYQYYSSEKLSSCWSAGFSAVGEVNWETCAYTARYIMKKLVGADAQFYDLTNIEPEFSLMSRRPGIARQYYDDNHDIYDHEFINLSTEKGGKKIRPPKYFDRLFDLDNPVEMDKIREVRKSMAIARHKIKLSNTSLYSDELLEVEKNNKVSAIKALRRDLI